MGNIFECYRIISNRLIQKCMLSDCRKCIELESNIKKMELNSIEVSSDKKGNRDEFRNKCL